MYRCLTPRRGWLRILWDRGLQHGNDVADQLERVAQIPGCRLAYNGGGIDIPHTAHMLEPVQSLLGLTAQPEVIDTNYEHTLWVPPKRVPYDFQNEAAAEIVDATGPGFVLCDDMGLGKTTTAIVAAETARRQLRTRAVIVAPLAARGAWLRELLETGAIDDHSQFCALGSRDIDSGVWRTEGVRWYFVHYDIALAWSARFGARPVDKPRVAVLDEAHAIKNSRTQRGRGAAVVAGGASRRILLTGTPMENRPSELWHLLTVAAGSGTWGGFNEFRARYSGGIHDGFGMQDQGPTHVEELRARMEPMYLRRTADAVALDMPALTRTLERVPRTKLDDRHDALLGFSVHSQDADMLLQAVLGGAGPETLRIIAQLRQYTSRAKLRATVEYVDNLGAQGESCVVFTWERAMAERIVGDLKMSAVAVTGDTPQDERDRLIDRFQASPPDEPWAFVATLDALREAVTLHRARIVVMHDWHWVLARMLQAEKRVHRIGQRRPCQSIWMLCENSIDTMLVQALSRKADVAQELLGIGEGADAIRELAFDAPVSIEAELDNAWRNW